MLPVFQKIDADINQSFFVGHRISKYFPNPFQFHPEIEILLVLKGTGTRIVGDSISRFRPGDLVMIGQNVPHVCYSDDEYTKEESSLISESIFILFKTEIFGNQLLSLPEFKCISKLIVDSRRGIKLKGKTCKEATSLIMSLNNSEGAKRIILLLSLLELIASGKEYQFLSSPLVQNSINTYDSDRLDRVYTYVINNFHHEISIEKACSIANLSKYAFCHYFKKITNKTFVRFLTEIRIAFACRSLTEQNLSVEKICYACGYSNVSYFIRQFKSITGHTPLSYKKKYVDS
jgi:AraC-like DNA-binding protein